MSATSFNQHRFVIRGEPSSMNHILTYSGRSGSIISHRAPSTWESLAFAKLTLPNGQIGSLSLLRLHFQSIPKQSLNAVCTVFSSQFVRLGSSWIDAECLQELRHETPEFLSEKWKLIEMSLDLTRKYDDYLLSSPFVWWFLLLFNRSLCLLFTFHYGILG